jgi:hypothetical protein
MIPYLIQSFRGGISEDSDKGVPGAFKFGQSLNIHGRDDILACGSTVTTLDETTVSDLVKYFVNASDGSCYAFGSTGSIYSIRGERNDHAVSFAYNDENGEIKGAAEFTLSAETRWIFWATNTSVARAQEDGQLAVPWAAGVATQDFRTTLNSQDHHTMKIGAGALRIANGWDLATVTYGGGFRASSLDLIPGNLIKTLEERDDFILLGTERASEDEEGHIWSWISTADSWVQKRKVPAKGVNALITTEIPLLQAGTNGELFIADFVGQAPLKAIPGGGQVAPGGVAILDDLAVFGVYGGTYPGIWSYGRRNKNRPFSLNYEYRLAKTVAGSSVSTISAVTVLNGDLLVSWGTTDGSTSDYGIDVIGATSRANAIYEGLEFDGGTPHEEKFVDTIAFVLSPLASGTSVSAKFKLIKEADWRYATLGGGGTTFSTTDQTIALFIVVKPGRIIEIGAELNASGSNTSEIHSIITYLSKEKYSYG